MKSRRHRSPHVDTMKCVHMHDHRIERHRNAVAAELVEKRLAVYCPKSTWKATRAPERASASVGEQPVSSPDNTGQASEVARAGGAED